MPRRRPGRERSCLSRATFTLAASENSTRASVTSAQHVGRRGTDVDREPGPRRSCSARTPRS